MHHELNVRINSDYHFASSISLVSDLVNENKCKRFRDNLTGSDNLNLDWRVGFSSAGSLNLSNKAGLW